MQNTQQSVFCSRPRTARGGGVTASNTACRTAMKECVAQCQVKKHRCTTGYCIPIARARIEVVKVQFKCNFISSDRKLDRTGIPFLNGLGITGGMPNEMKVFWNVQGASLVTIGKQS